MTRKTLILIIAFFGVFSSCNYNTEENYVVPDEFATVKNGQFYQNGEKVNFIGANFWYGAILGPRSGKDRQWLLPIIFSTY